MFSLAVIKMIGPLQPKPASPLPSHFQKIMEDAGEEGVVYMAFGTVTQATMTKEAEHAIARALGRLPMKVIWKKKGMIARGDSPIKFQVMIVGKMTSIPLTLRPYKKIIGIGLSSVSFKNSVRAGGRFLFLRSL